MEIQQSLFESNDDISLLRREIQALTEQLANLRRGLFARHGQLEMQIQEIQREVRGEKKDKQLELSKLAELVW
jgi:hypothetical protein